MKMNKKWKKIWVAALRGGHFKQGSGALRDDRNRACCLGVLADLMGAEWYQYGVGYNYRCDLQQPDAQYLNSKALHDAGLTPTQQKTLAKKNDEGDSFVEIANYIENTL